MKFIVILLAICAFVSSVVAIQNAICGLKHSADGVGPIACAAYRPTWSYNSEANECVEFIYGGCGGNDNRFGTKDACEKMCKEEKNNPGRTR